LAKRAVTQRSDRPWREEGGKLTHYRVHYDCSAAKEDIFISRRTAFSSYPNHSLHFIESFITFSSSDGFCYAVFFVLRRWAEREIVLNWRGETDRQCFLSFKVVYAVFVESSCPANVSSSFRPFEVTNLPFSLSFFAMNSSVSNCFKMCRTNPRAPREKHGRE